MFANSLKTIAVYLIPLLLFLTVVTADAGVPGELTTTVIKKNWRLNSVASAPLKPNYEAWSRFQSGYFWPDETGIWCRVDGTVDVYASVSLYRRGGFEHNDIWRPRIAAVVIDLPKGEKVRGLEIFKGVSTRSNHVTIILSGKINCRQGHQLQFRVFGSTPGSKSDRRKFYPQTYWRVTRFRLTVS